MTKSRDGAAGRLTHDRVSRAEEQVVGLRDADDLTELLNALVVAPLGDGER